MIIGNNKLVYLKLMRYKRNFKKEIIIIKLDFDSNYVVIIIIIIIIEKILI